MQITSYAHCVKRRLQRAGTSVRLYKITSLSLPPIYGHLPVTEWLTVKRPKVDSGEAGKTLLVFAPLLAKRTGFRAAGSQALR